MTKIHFIKIQINLCILLLFWLSFLLSFNLNWWLFINQIYLSFRSEFLNSLYFYVIFELFNFLWFNFLDPNFVITIRIRFNVNYCSGRLSIYFLFNFNFFNIFITFVILKLNFLILNNNSTVTHFLVLTLFLNFKQSILLLF